MGRGGGEETGVMNAKLGKKDVVRYVKEVRMKWIWRVTNDVKRRWKAKGNKVVA